ncbi:hypothetical protein ACN469_07920 [Corallococcus terminator]
MVRIALVPDSEWIAWRRLPPLREIGVRARELEIVDRLDLRRVACVEDEVGHYRSFQCLAGTRAQEVQFFLVGDQFWLLGTSNFAIALLAQEA